MSIELEDRLARAADALPGPTTDARERARRAALAALPSRRRRRGLVLLAPAFVVLVAAAAVVLAAPWRHGPLTTERALAALGHLPVIHAVVQQPLERGGEPTPSISVVELATGRERPVSQRTEYWYDEQRHELRVRLLVGGTLLPGAEYLQTPTGFYTDRGVQHPDHQSELDPALAAFATGYREALNSGTATVVGDEVVDGHDATILRFPVREDPAGKVMEEVAVSKDDYRPLRIRWFSGEPPAWSDAPRVIAIETVARDPRDFEAPTPGAPRPARQSGADVARLEPAQAANALGVTGFWPGAAVDGVNLDHIELTRLTTEWTDGRTTEAHALMLQYGDGTPSSLTLNEGTSAAETPFFQALGGRADPPDGELQLMGTGRLAGGKAQMWFGSMKRGSVYISLRSSRREVIIAAAKALAPLG
jgi:hypothetical protein